ncbi:hypothetical protein DL95DRAFT_417964 [Leptodontidium sp. 2 PMI_412]|nr:hypothetical protein DL95DRAFT_417964 [Leptodontidium sp. 2 PMI_412]
MCEEYRIYRVPFIPHSTHYMQPADVKCFNKIKGFHIPSENPLKPHYVQDTLQGFSELKSFIQDRKDVLSSSPARRIEAILNNTSLTLKSAHLETQGYTELKQGLRDQQNRKTEWTGGNIKADIPIIVVGDALRIKNTKVAKKRQDKSDTRVRQIGIRDSVIKRKSDALDIKIQKQTNLKNTGSKAITKASLERANAQAEYNKAIKQKTDLQQKYDTEDRIKAERLEQLQIDPVLKYIYLDYSVLDPAIIAIEAETQSDYPGIVKDPESYQESFVINTQGDRSVFNSQQDFITVPPVTLTTQEEHAF